MGPEDGCMHVVPSAFDELFNSSDPKHLRPETPETPETHGEALSCKAGEAGSGQTLKLIWFNGSIIINYMNYMSNFFLVVSL